MGSRYEKILKWNSDFRGPRTVPVFVVVEHSVNRHRDFHSGRIARQNFSSVRFLSPTLLENPRPISVKLLILRCSMCVRMDTEVLMGFLMFDTM